MIKDHGLPNSGLPGGKRRTLCLLLVRLLLTAVVRLVSEGNVASCDHSSSVAYK